MKGPGNKSVMVLDNGASTVKAGLLRTRDQDPVRIIPNAIVRSKGDRKTYIGHELEDCEDHSSLHYRLPFEKGYVADWDAQKAVWDGIFSDQVLMLDTTQSSLVLTEPYFNLPNIQEVYDQFIFEEYDFQSYFRCTPAVLIPYGDLFKAQGKPYPECIIVVDSGFSFTHVVPIIQGNIIWNAVKRLDVGGKLLTNQLKEHISFRQWNMMDETYIVNEIKEACCFVSTDFSADLEICRTNLTSNTIVQEYVLPDLSSYKKGHIRYSDEILVDNEQVVVMNNERFTVTETIFRPDDIGLDQSGLAATIAISISLLPDDLQGMFWSNIGLIGGNIKLPGFRQRLLSELRTLVPAGSEVHIHESDVPITEAYNSGLMFAGTSEYSDRCITREDYAENGSNAARRKFRDWNSKPVLFGVEPGIDAVAEKGKDKGKQREDDHGRSDKTTRSRGRNRGGRLAM